MLSHIINQPMMQRPRLAWIKSRCEQINSHLVQMIQRVTNELLERFIVDCLHHT